jgi:hypothetical protein
MWVRCVFTVASVRPRAEGYLAVRELPGYEHEDVELALSSLGERADASLSARAPARRDFVHGDRSGLAGPRGLLL